MGQAQPTAATNHAVVRTCRSGDGTRPDAFTLGQEDRHGHIRYAGEASCGLIPEKRERIRLAIAGSPGSSGERVS
jgi:hypothetical protein